MAKQPRTSRAVVRKAEELLSNPNALDIICAHIASLGTIEDLALTWGVNYGHIAIWLDKTPERRSAHLSALKARDRLRAERAMVQLDAIANSDLRKLYDSEGRLLPVSQWPDDIAQAVAGVDVFEEFAGTGRERTKIGETRKIKLWDKLRGIELIGKTLAMFTDKVEVSGKITLEALVAGSNEPDKEEG